MKIKLLSFLIIASSLFSMRGIAQSPPTIDDNWELNTNKSDEFTTFNLSLWEKLYSGNSSSNQYFRPNNVTIDAGKLNIEVYSSNGSIYSGFIKTKNFDYSYGYFEISAKLPGYYNNGQPCGKGFWPQFWTYYTASGIHDEIDILEPSGCQYEDGSSNVSGWFDENGSGGADKVSGNVWYTHNRPLFEDFHKYAVEWHPNRIIFYFDDKLIYDSYYNTRVPDHDQRVVIAVGMDGGNCAPYSNTTWPLDMEVEYFRYYELKKDCYSNSTILNNSQLNSFDFKVKRNITFGNGSSSISVSNGEKLTFRVTNEVIINGDFSVPLDSELNIIPTTCN